MNANLKVTSHKLVIDAQVLLVTSARLRNSEPFSGAFEVFDLDYCVHKKEDGTITADVLCSIEGQPMDEETLLEIELLGPYEGCTGFIGGVVSRLSSVTAPATA